MGDRVDGATEAKLRASFARQQLMATFGAAIAPGRVEIAVPILELARQQHGFGHAALSLMREDAEVLTVEAKINLLAPAAGDRLVATAKVVKAGRRLTVVTAEVEAETRGRRKPVALLQATMIAVDAS